MSITKNILKIAKEIADRVEKEGPMELSVLLSSYWKTL